MRRNRFGFTPYVPVGQKLAKGEKSALAHAKKEKRAPQPVKPKGREIAVNFWGKAWCDHLGTMRDLENRLERGRRYLRNGSVVDLVIIPCKIKSLVAGSSTYKVSIEIKPLAKEAWELIKNLAKNSVRSVIDLLAGKIDESLIRLISDPQKGIFPKSNEIQFSCSCPDGAYVCKHVAAAFYGVGTLLDTQPELLFVIRDVDSSELVGMKAVASSLGESLAAESSLEGINLEEIFGIELEKPNTTPAKPTPPNLGNKKNEATQDQSGDVSKPLKNSKTTKKPKPIRSAMASSPITPKKEDSSLANSQQKPAKKVPNKTKSEAPVPAPTKRTTPKTNSTKQRSAKEPVAKSPTTPKSIPRKPTPKKKD